MLDTKGFGTRLKSAIRESDYTQKQLSEKLQINQDTMTNYVKGTIPRADILYNICELINVSADYLLTGKKMNSSLIKDKTETTYTADSELKEFLKRLIIEDQNLKNIGLTEREQNLILAFRHLDDLDKKILENTVNLIFKRVQKINLGELYPYNPGDEDAAAINPDEHIIKKHA